MGKKAISRVSRCRDEYRTLSVKIPDKDIEAGARVWYKWFADDTPTKASECDVEKLVDMVTKATEGFSLKSFIDLRISSMAKIRAGLFPGSYQHLLLLLFESPEDLHSTQTRATDWIIEYYPHRKGAGSISGADFDRHILLDQSIFRDEVRMLRKLVAPLREELTTKPVYWITSRRLDAGETAVQFEKSLKVIDEFKTALSLGSAAETAHNRIFGSSKRGQERMSAISLRDVRLDSCKATLLRGEGQRGDAISTRFLFHDREHVHAKSPASGRATGWLPPDNLECPFKPLPAHPQPASTLVNDNVDLIIQELFLKTALWLAVARGFAAVHLFCDLVRSFTRFEPRAEACEAEIAVLHFLSQLGTACNDEGDDDDGHVDDETTSRDPPRVPYEHPLATRNLEYFRDVRASELRLTENLLQTSTLKAQHLVNSDNVSADDMFSASQQLVRRIESDHAERGSLGGS